MLNKSLSLNNTKKIIQQFLLFFVLLYYFFVRDNDLFNMNILQSPHTLLRLLLFLTFLRIHQGELRILKRNFRLLYLLYKSHEILWKFEELYGILKMIRGETATDGVMSE